MQETVKEICKKVWNKYHSCGYITESWLIELAKEYGVEIENVNL